MGENKRCFLEIGSFFPKIHWIFAILDKLLNIFDKPYLFDIFRIFLVFFATIYLFSGSMDIKIHKVNGKP